MSWLSKHTLEQASRDHQVSRDLHASRDLLATPGPTSVGNEGQDSGNTSTPTRAQVPNGNQRPSEGEVRARKSNGPQQAELHLDGVPEPQPKLWSSEAKPRGPRARSSTGFRAPHTGAAGPGSLRSRRAGQSAIRRAHGSPFKQLEIFQPGTDPGVLAQPSFLKPRTGASPVESEDVGSTAVAPAPQPHRQRSNINPESNPTWEPALSEITITPRSGAPALTTLVSARASAKARLSSSPSSKTGLADLCWSWVGSLSWKPTLSPSFSFSPELVGATTMGEVATATPKGSMRSVARDLLIWGTLILMLGVAWFGV